MLQLTLPSERAWDEDLERFVSLDRLSVRLEHSLYTVAQWEAEFEVAFLHPTRKKSDAELARYIDIMADRELSDTEVLRLASSKGREINEYIGAPGGATKITEYQTGPDRQKIITAEVVYGWMIAYRIPLDPCQHWHLNRLITLIRVCGIQQDPNPKKRPMADVIAERNALNAARNAEAEHV